MSVAWKDENVSTAAVMDTGYFKSARWLLSSRRLTHNSHNKEEQRTDCGDQEQGQTDSLGDGKKSQ